MQQVAISALKFDGTTAVSFTPVNPASGPQNLSVWHDPTVGNSMQTRKVITHSVVWNGARTVRRAEVTLKAPQTVTDSVTGLAKVVNTLPVTLSVPVATAIPTVLVEDSLAELFSALANPSNGFISAIARGESFN